MAEILIAPSILSGDFANMGETVRKADAWGADWIHCDVMDGVYVPNLTFGMPTVAAIRPYTAKPLDVHLMIEKPEKYVDRFADAGADIVTFHPDASDNAEECLDLIRSRKKGGLVFNPNVSIEKYAHLFPKCDLITVMTVYAGYGGQKLIESCVDRIAKVRKILAERNLDIPVEADGGITVDNARLAVNAGATVLVAGSAVFRAERPEETVAKLKMRN